MDSEVEKKEKPNRLGKSYRPPRRVQLNGKPRYILGSGSYGVVYTTKNEVANKSFKLMDLDWIREVAVTKYLDHPSIIKYNKVGIKQDHKYDLEKKRFSYSKTYTTQAQMQFYKATLIDFDSFSDSDIMLIMNNLASAITHSHNKNIIHRDIKESNILVSLSEETGEINKAVLCDFGLGKYAIDIDHRPDYEMVTISHRAPEMELSLHGDLKQVTESSGELLNQIERKKINDYEFLFKYDNRIDTWSFGMVLLFLMTGESFYSFVQSKHQFSDVLKNISEFYQFVNRFLGKYVNRDLKYLDFYMDILRMTLARYEDRVSMEVVFVTVNKFIASCNIPLNGFIYAINPESKKLPRCFVPANIQRVSGTVEFIYKKKRSVQAMWKNFVEKCKNTVLCEIPFLEILSRDNIDNIGLFVATDNLFKNTVKYQENLSEIFGIKISPDMIFASCYILSTCVLIDNHAADDCVWGSLSGEDHLIKIAFQILTFHDYNIIPLFGFLANQDLDILEIESNSDMSYSPNTQLDRLPRDEIQLEK